MSQREYLWCGDTVFPDQSAADVITLPSTPASILRGAFTISYAQQWKVGDAAEGARVLLSVNDATAWKIRIISLTVLSPTRGTSRLQVHTSAGVLVQSPIFTHTEGRPVHFGFDAARGRLTVEGGQEEADSSTEGTPWNVLDASMRLGGQVGGGDSARGNVSLPYYRAPDAVTVASLAGASLRAHYRWDAFTSGTPPDVAIATNLQGDTALDLAQATEAQRPHLVGQSWDFDEVASQRLDVASLSPVPMGTGDMATTICVAKFDATSSDGLFHLNDGVVAGSGFELTASSGLLFAKALTVSGGLITANVAVDTALHVFRATLKADEIAVAIDGVETITASAGNGGLLNDLDQIRMGGIIAGGQALDGQIIETVVLTNATDAQITNVENFLIAKWI